MSVIAMPDSLAQPPLPVRRFSVDEYHRMMELGILTDEDQVELLEGWIVPKMPRKPPHDAVIAIAHNQVVGPLLPAGFFCRGQSAITTRDSEPEPDLAIIRGSERDYLKRHPGPASTDAPAAQSQWSVLATTSRPHGAGSSPNRHPRRRHAGTGRSTSLRMT